MLKPIAHQGYQLIKLTLFKKLKRLSYFRPDWDRVTTLINEEKWKDLTNNKSSMQMLDILVSEMSGKKHSSAASDVNHGLVIKFK